MYSRLEFLNCSPHGKENNSQRNTANSYKAAQHRRFTNQTRATRKFQAECSKATEIPQAMPDENSRVNWPGGLIR